MKIPKKNKNDFFKRENNIFELPIVKKQNQTPDARSSGQHRAFPSTPDLFSSGFLRKPRSLIGVVRYSVYFGIKESFPYSVYSYFIRTIMFLAKLVVFNEIPAQFKWESTKFGFSDRMTKWRRFSRRGLPNGTCFNVCDLYFIKKM